VTSHRARWWLCGLAAFSLSVACQSAQSLGASGDRCSSDRDCQSGLCTPGGFNACQWPGGASAPCAPHPFEGCGCVRNSDCQVDGGNTRQLVCAPSECGGLQCSTSCNCEPGQTCDSAGYCHPPACVRDPDCPVDQTCASNVCTAKRCSRDSDCSAYCDDGICLPYALRCAELAY
jgi:hypothetical protein